MLEKLAIAGIVTLVVAYFIIIFIEATDYQERKEKEKQETIELRVKNARLEEQLKMQEEKKVEQNKQKTEINK